MAMIDTVLKWRTCSIIPCNSLFLVHTYREEGIDQSAYMAYVTTSLRRFHTG
jgi:hypothetical protein